MPLPTSTRWRFYAVPTIAVAVLLLLRASMPLKRSFDERALRDVPAETRARLHAASLAEVREVCLGPNATRGPLRAHCLEQARFVQLLPECGSDCRAAAAAVTRIRGAGTWR
jgi:hypothetical protein